jgi:hypothetical protein
MNAITESDIGNLRHMLGLRQNNKTEWGYRNHFGTFTMSDDYPSMLRLEKAGYVKRNKKRYEGGGMIFNATDKAFKLLQFNEEQTNRALGKDRP